MPSDPVPISCSSGNRMNMSPPQSSRQAPADDEIRPLLERSPFSSQQTTFTMKSKDVEALSATAPDAKPTEAVASAEGIRNEHELTFSRALRLYPASIGWSAFVSLGVIMLAFDPQLLGNLYATPQFQRDFGYEYEGSVSLSSSPPPGHDFGYSTDFPLSTSSVRQVPRLVGFLFGINIYCRCRLADWAFYGESGRPSCWRSLCCISYGLVRS